MTRDDILKFLMKPGGHTKFCIFRHLTTKKIDPSYHICPMDKPKWIPPKELSDLLMEMLVDKTIEKIGMYYFLAEKKK